jgi:KaiC/GvpD/RAD55 family RecA-like ATPase
MERIPFGIDKLDSTMNGGVPRGSVVLLIGEAGAGAQEFVYTAAAMNGLGVSGNDDLFDLHYGELADDAQLPEEIHYVSFTQERAQFESAIGMTMDDEIAETGLDHVNFHPLVKSYFHNSPVPRSWYAGETTDLGSLRKRHEERESVLSVLGDTLSRHASGNLVVIDSISDLAGVLNEEMQWEDIVYVVKSLQKASHQWSGMILLHADYETLTDTQYGQLVNSCSGTLQFEWESGGSTRARTMVVKSFRGVLSQIEEENIIKYETDIGDAGFDISDVRKIR